MPLRVVIEYLENLVTWERVFFISHDGTLETSEDFDPEYNQAMAEFTNSELDDPTLFTVMFWEGRARNILTKPFFRKAFCKAIYEQGLNAFLDGDDISEEEELEILAHTLSWELRNKKYSYKDKTLCQRIYQLMGPHGFAEIDVSVERDMPYENQGIRQSAIEQTLRINLSGETIDIVTWSGVATKKIIDPLTLEYTFDTELDEEITEDVEDLCRCLGTNAPDDDFGRDIVDDPFYPITDSKGKFVLLYTLTDDPVSTSTAKAIYRFSDKVAVIEAVDAITEILWSMDDDQNEKYKLTVAEIASPDIEAELDARYRQIPMFKSETRLGRKLQHDMLRPIWTWMFRHAGREDDRGSWIRIDHENDDEIILEEVFEP
jgi:hypothetical protein